MNHTTAISAKRARPIRLTLADQQRVAAILAVPPVPSAGLDRAMAAHRALVRPCE